MLAGTGLAMEEVRLKPRPLLPSLYFVYTWAVRAGPATTWVAQMTLSVLSFALPLWCFPTEVFKAPH